MRCPDCKKHTELKTLRTKAYSASRYVERQRYCPRCKKRFCTVERFREDIQKQLDEASTENRKLRNTIYAQQNTLQRFQRLLSDFEQFKKEVSNLRKEKN